MKRDIHETKDPEEKYEADPNFRPSVSLAPYWLLAALRLLLALAPQTGYIHPDEFFQSVEVINGDVFQVASNRPWEFNSSQPLRSVTLPFLVFGAPLLVLKNIAPFLSLWFDVSCITPYALLVVPRITSCLLSFVTDYCLYKICFLYGQNYRCRLITLASSFVMLIYGTRTFTNTIEMALASMLIYVVTESMAKSDQIIYQDEYLRDCYNNSNNIRDRIRYHRMRLALPWHSFTSVFFIASITVMGVFNRPTFLAFAFPPIFFWLLRGMGSQIIGISDFNMRTAALIVSSLPALFGLTLIDSVYYGALTMNEIRSKNVSILRDVVFTPFNFIKYNLNPQNLAEHGIHWRMTHFLVNVPLLYNVLGVAGLVTFAAILYRGVLKQYSTLPRVQSIIGLMTSSFILPIAALSVFPHQEARFLIPVTLPLTFLYTQRIRNIEDASSAITSRIQSTGHKVFMKREAKVPDIKDGLLIVWYVVNIGMALFFGFIHQAGVVPLLNHMNLEMTAKSRLTTVHLVTSHVYPLPVSFLFLKFGKPHQILDKSGYRYQRARDFYNYELGSSISVDHIAIKLAVIIEQAEKTWSEKRMKYRVYYAAPSSLIKEVQSSCFSQGLNATIDRIFFPHLSTEALPTVASFNASDLLTVHGALKTLSDLAHQMGLALIRVTPLAKNHEPAAVLEKKPTDVTKDNRSFESGANERRILVESEMATESSRIPDSLISVRPTAEQQSCPIVPQASCAAEFPLLTSH
ncbi:Alg9-like mannosyltransferase family [Nesidiocoris tenuis]|uniref:Mannosyltransferase n=1 Tax=Nesidiocoris tenuis TaxID=355587 RepID=A0ABN7AN94_9HEMI|nr:Alg9-like mannosyltransferase family [Nesidiocoris tenuis]